nr:hypothetical protein [Angustibacter aerolatus]
MPWRLVGVVLLLLAALLVTPVSAALGRRRRRRAAASPGAHVEARWADLQEQLGDLGVRLDTGSTPRQVDAEPGRCDHPAGRAPRRPRPGDPHRRALALRPHRAGSTTASTTTCRPCCRPSPPPAAAPTASAPPPSPARACSGCATRLGRAGGAVSRLELRAAGTARRLTAVRLHRRR